MPWVSLCAGSSGNLDLLRHGGGFRCRRGLCTRARIPCPSSLAYKEKLHFFLLRTFRRPSILLCEQDKRHFVTDSSLLLLLLRLRLRLAACIEKKGAILLRTIPCPSSLCPKRKRHSVTDASVSIEFTSTKTTFCYGQFRVHQACPKKRHFVTDNSVSIKPMSNKGAILLRPIVSIKPMSRKKTPFCYGPFCVHRACVKRNRHMETP